MKNINNSKGVLNMKFKLLRENEQTLTYGVLLRETS